MKKIFRNMLIIGALLLGCTQAQADIVGNEDNSSPYLGAFSDPLVLEPEQTLYVEFVNYSSKQNNWNNWLVQVANAEHGAEGYTEYFVLRADNAAMSPQGESWNNQSWFTSLTSNFVWETFKDDMDGATVKLTVKRLGKSVDVYADMTAQSGARYFEHFIMDCGDGTQNIVVYLSVDGCHLDVDYESVQITENGAQEVEGQLVGATDNSSMWWTAFSNYYTLAPNQSLRLNFKNYTTGQENWQNWVAAVTSNANRNGAFYSEYFVLRADGFGWGDSYNENVMLDYPMTIDETGQTVIDWAAFRRLMDGADVELTLTRIASSVDITAQMTATTGEIFVLHYSCECGDGQQVIRLFLTVDNSHIIITDSEISGDLPEGLVGNIDYSSAWWQAFSDYYTLKPGETIDMVFKNYGDQEEPWHNYNLCVSTDADRAANGYAEYFVIRSDLFGWGDAYEQGVFNNNYPTTTDAQGATVIDWNKFKAFMNGAMVHMNVRREAEKVIVHFDIEGTDGNLYFEEFVTPCGNGRQNIRLFLICDTSYLIIDGDSIEVTPAEGDDTTGISELNSDAASTPLYNLQGVRVEKAQRGVYIQNGKKYVK
jgi:hypothetical protein